MGNEIQQLNDIALKVGRLEVLQEANTKAIAEMASSVNRLVDKLDKSDDIVRETDQRARSAHHRIDEMRDAVIRLETKLRDNQKWLVGTLISSAGLLLAAVGFFLKVVSG